MPDQSELRASPAGFITRRDPTVSWPAAAGWLAAAALATWFYWRLLLRRYSTSDLNQPIGIVAGTPSR